MLKLRVRFFFPLLVALAALAAACGGGGGGSNGGVVPAPTTTPHAGPTQVPIGPTAAPQVVLTGGGYTLMFFVPAVTTGTTSTMSADLETTLPAGTVAPQNRRHYTPPHALATGFTGLVYLSVMSKDAVGFASAPSFQYTLPTGTTIPSGSNTYILYWDPAASGSTGWIPLLGPGKVSGQTVSFPAVATGVQFEAETPYVFALAETTQTVPTATPAPTPTPTPVPTAAPSSSPATLPAYCSQYTASTSPGIPVNVTDDSGLGAVLVVYAANSAGQWLGKNGQYQTSPTATAVPLPAACFSTTTGSKGTVPLQIPIAGGGGRIYFAYASGTPDPSSTTAPNPFGTANTSGPPEGYSSAPYPFDVVEFGTSSGATIDTSQVNALGLPLELSLTGGPLPSGGGASCATPAPSRNIVGVTSCNYAQIFQAMEQIPNYQNNVIAQSFNGRIIDLRILSPLGAYQNTSFNWNLFASPAPSPFPAGCTPGQPYGMLSCALESYKQQPRLFTSNVAGVLSPSKDYYCASSDGVSNFIFTDVGSSASCAGSPTPNPSAPLKNPFTMSVNLFTSAQIGTAPCWYSELFQQPFGNAQIGSGQVFHGADAFALWKALSADLNYGTVLSTAQHPVAAPSPNVSPAPPASTTLAQLFPPGQMNNQYDQIMHQYFDGNLSYGLPYDDLYTLESGLTYVAGESFNVRINAVPVASAPIMPPPNPPLPSSCPTVAPDIGNYY